MVSKFRQVPLIIFTNTVVKMRRDCYNRFSHFQVDFWSHRQKKTSQTTKSAAVHQHLKQKVTNVKFFFVLHTDTIKIICDCTR